MNIGNLLKILIRIISVLSIGQLICILLALFYKENPQPFIETIYVYIAIAIPSLAYMKYYKNTEVSKKESYIIVPFAWIFIITTGSLPFIFSGHFTVVDAIFESTSGFSTTGSSILTNVEILPKSILFWRSLICWIGGIGIIVIVIIIMPSLQIGANNLFSLESSVGEKILPKIKTVGLYLFIIYNLLNVLLIILLVIGGMPLFDSVCHSFCTIATAGFSTKNSSIASYSPYIQYVIGTFMLLAATNFILYYYAVRGNLDKIKKNDEFWFYIKFVATFVIIVTAILFFQTERPLEKSFRDAFFQVSSIISCTGLVSDDYILWPTAGWVIMFLLLFAGGSTGSTTGSIKMARHAVAILNIKHLFLKKLHPKSVSSIKFNNRELSNETNLSILTFIFWYFVSFVIGTLILVALDVDGKTAASSIATAMAGAGPGIGTVGPMSNFAHLSDAVKLILSFFMLLGRLEIYTLLMIFSPAFWKS